MDKRSEASWLDVEPRDGKRFPSHLWVGEDEMVYAYEADFERNEEDDCWYASFVDFEEAITSGNTVEETASSAADLLTLLLAEYLDEGKTLPVPSFHEPPLSVVCVRVDDDAIKGTQLVTVKEAADLLGVSPSRVSQLLSDGRLGSVEYHGRRMVTLESVNERIANKPAPHRPRKLVEVSA